MAAAPLLRRAIPHHHLNKTICSLVWRPCHTTTTTSDTPQPISKPPSTPLTPTTHVNNKTFLLGPKQNHPKRVKKNLIDIGPQSLASIVQNILHSGRYKNGERLTLADEEIVVEKLLAYHPHSEDKIGCGIDYIMVDRHPHYRFGRCLFVVRTDGGVIDFSYRKCIEAYKRSSN